MGWAGSCWSPVHLQIRAPLLTHLAPLVPAADNYYLLPFCKPKGEAAKHKWGGLGEVLQGNELIDSQLPIQFKGEPPPAWRPGRTRLRRCLKAG